MNPSKRLATALHRFQQVEQVWTQEHRSPFWKGFDPEVAILAIAIVSTHTIDEADLEEALVRVVAAGDSRVELELYTADKAPSLDNYTRVLPGEEL